MTPEHIELHRKRFEELSGFSALALGRIRESGMYAIKGVEPMWQGYLMCAENLEVELPEPESKVMDRLDAGYNLGISDCRLKIESQGIKVKE